MSRLKPRRRPPLIKSLPWFLPALLAVALAGFSTHPVVLIPLILANALAMGAVCHAIGFDPEPSFARTLLRRGAAHTVMFTSYTAVMFLLVAWPLVRLMQAPSLSGALLLAAALVVALASLWRMWPAFGLVFVWDDAYPGQEDGSWIFTAVARSIAFGRHLSAEERFFSHFLPAALALLVLSFSAVVLTGLYGMLPSELRISALVIYGLVLLPLGCMVIANRTLRAMLCEGRGRPQSLDQKQGEGARVDPLPVPAKSGKAPRVEPMMVAEPAAAASAVRTAPVVPTGRPQAELDADLLEAARAGDIDRALALLEAGADADSAAREGDRDQRPVLVLAALLPDVRLLRALITRGAKVNRVHAGSNALLAASRDSWHGRADAVMTLLANGANASAVDGEGNSALHGAVLCGEPTIAAMLLDAGAPVNVLNRAGYSPLAAACRAANWNLTRFLLERGAKATPIDGEPALVAAAGIPEDDDEGVRVLLKHRAAVNATDSHGRSALMVAAAEGHERICRTLRGAGADVGVADRRGSTALMEAARAGAPRIVELFAQAQPDPRARDNHGRDALTLACQSPQAQAETVRALLALGAQPRDAGMDGRSALDHAAASGRWDLVALLDPDTPLPASMSDALAPEAGADSPDHLLDALRFGHWAVASTFARRAREWPPSQLAAMYLELSAPGHSASRAWLLEHGLDAESRLGAPRLRDDDTQIDDAETGRPLGRRLFDALVQQLPASQDAVVQLLDAGATPAGAGIFLQALACLGDSDAEATLLLRMLGAGGDPFGSDGRLRSAVHVAAAVAHPRVLDELLARGGDPNVRDGQGRTPLFAALEAGNRVLERVRSLVAHGADPETSDAHGETPLGVAMGQPEVERWLSWSRWPLPRRPLRATDLPQAAASGDAEAVRRLLDLGFAVDTRDDKGATALLRACGAGHRDVAAVLLDAGADATLPATTGATPLVAAVTARRETLVALLVERGIAVDQRLPGETTATMIGAAMGYPEIVETLVDAGADVNAHDGSGHTPLHAAAQYCFESSDSLRARRLLDVLISRKADINHADNEGKTALLLLLGAHKRPGVSCDATHLGALLPALLDAGAEAGHADQRGVTALHACAMHALLPPARTLMARGADRSAADAFGRTAGDVARTLGLVDVAHELGVRVGAVPSVRQTLRQPAQPND